MLNSKQFIEAMEIISISHSSVLKINRVAGETVREGVDSVRLEIVECVPAVINRLRDAGYMLGMTNGVMTVDKVGNK
jgi:hypothetical protein